MGTSSDRVRRAVDAYIDYLRKKTETLLLLLLYRGRQMLGRARARAVLSEGQPGIAFADEA